VIVKKVSRSDLVADAGAADTVQQAKGSGTPGSVDGLHVLCRANRKLSRSGAGRARNQPNGQAYRDGNNHFDSSRERSKAAGAERNGAAVVMKALHAYHCNTIEPCRADDLQLGRSLARIEINEIRIRGLLGRR
jgi:hypothetical protein